MAKQETLDMALSREYCRIVLGMDQLYRRGSGSTNEASFDREGLVPINLTDEQPNAYDGWEAVLADLQSLGSRYMQIEDEVRRNYMQQQIGSLLALAEWCSGKAIPFRDKVRDFLYVNENPVAQAERERLHRQLDTLLAESGYTGSLVEKVTAWEAQRQVPPARLEAVLNELLAEAKARVAARMFPQIADAEVMPEVVYGVPYNAYCDYVNGKMYINGDLAYTYEGLRHLVTHECFPGHTTHMYIREQGVKAGTLPPDAGLVITNTASSSVFEGIADNGMLFIEWGDTPDDRIYDVYQTIRSISGLNAAHMLHAEGRTEDEVRAFLREFAFGQENWIDSRLRFITHALRSPFIYSYWRGNEAVYAAFSRVEAHDRDRFYAFLYTSMLSADTVLQYG